MGLNMCALRGIDHEWSKSNSSGFFCLNCGVRHVFDHSIFDSSAHGVNPLPSYERATRPTPPPPPPPRSLSPRECKDGICIPIDIDAIVSKMISEDRIKNSRIPHIPQARSEAPKEHTSFGVGDVIYFVFGLVAGCGLSGFVVWLASQTGTLFN